MRGLSRRSLLAFVVLGTTVAPVSGATAAMPSTSGLGPRAGVVVANATTGKLLLSRNANHPRILASVTKLFTVTAAVKQLGADWAPQTRVVASGEVVGNRFNGDLYLIGGGDPTLSRAGINRLAADTASKLGVTKISGRLRVDAGAFDEWRGSDRTRGASDPDMGGVLGALTLDRGWRGSSPSLNAAVVFRTALRSAGVTVSGSPTLAPAPVDATAVAELAGPVVRDLSSRVLMPSDNFVAETLLKNLVSADGSEARCRVAAGLTSHRSWLAVPSVDDQPCVTQRAATPATTAAATRVLRTTLRSMIGVLPQIHDGSGLSRRNKVSPALVTRLLVRLRADPTVGPVVEAGLPRAGVSGTLAQRMRGTAAQRRCRAKTGTINGVSTLAGYCTTVSGRELAFAILQNGSSSWSARKFQDRFVAQLAARN